MILTDADQLREALRVALAERDEARAEVERLRAIAMRLSHREGSLPHDLRDAWDELEKLRARGEELLDEGLVFFYGHERMADVAERQREACAERFRPSKEALVFYKRREAEEIVRSTPLVTDAKADGGAP